MGEITYEKRDKCNNYFRFFFFYFLVLIKIDVSIAAVMNQINIVLVGAHAITENGALINQVFYLFVYILINLFYLFII
jgi:hypothetical protein